MAKRLKVGSEEELLLEVTRSKYMGSILLDMISPEFLGGKLSFIHDVQHPLPSSTTYGKKFYGENRRLSYQIK